MSHADILRAGYRQLGTALDDWRDRIVGAPRTEWRDALAVHLQPGAWVLELGCGAGDSGLRESRHVHRTGGRRDLPWILAHS